MRRVAIIGSAGSGKSVFARELGRVTGLPVIHLDRLFWRPGWVPMPRDEWRALQAELVAGDRWIIDGNYGGTMEIRLSAADTVFFFDLPRLTCLLGVMRRFIQYRRSNRPDLAPGLEERLSFDFLRWIWRYPRSERPDVLERLSALGPPTQIVQVRSRREARQFLMSLEQIGPAAARRI